MARPTIVTDEQIVTRARAVFVERGYAARTRQISHAVGVTWGAIARRFGTKRALFLRAMAEPAQQAACAPGAEADLPQLLKGLYAHLSACWPLQLQRRLAPPAAGRGHAGERIEPEIAAAVVARCGALRSDIEPQVLARLVLALLVGEVAQRYVAHEPAAPADAAFIDTVAQLLRPQNPTEAAWTDCDR
jgi:AcrR family transcriptional regulator